LSWQRAAMIRLAQAIRRSRRSAALRDLAVLALLDADLTVAEVARLRGADVHHVPGGGWEVVVHHGHRGSRRRERVALDGDQSRALHQYLAESGLHGSDAALIGGQRGPLSAAGLSALVDKLRRRWSEEAA
jgi:hypothetical protein